MNEAKLKAILEAAKAINSAEKSPKAPSLRVKKLIVRYGKDAQYPVCQAALEVWRLEAELATVANNGVKAAEFLISIEREKKQEREFYELLYKKRMEKEVIQSAAHLKRMTELIKETQKSYQATKKLFELTREMNAWAVTHFKRERDLVILGDKIGDSKSVKALRALRRLRRSWKADANRSLKAGERRTLGLLEKLHDKVIKAEWAKGEAVAGYKEALAGGARPLSDEVWQKRLTAREAHSHIAHTDGLEVAGDKDAKEIRRTLKSMGIEPAEDQPGRKWKGPSPEKEEPPKKTRGRPRKSPDLIFVDTEEVQHFQAKGGRTAVKGSETKAKELKAPWEFDWEQANVERRRKIEQEITRRKRLQKGSVLNRSSLGQSKWKPEGKIKGRTDFFAKWIDSLAAI